MLIYLSLILGSYLLGSVSSAVIVAKIWRLPDPRSQGSKNPGATNVLRIGGKIPAIITLLGDGCKGFAPTLLASYLLMPSWVIGAVMLAALLGHIFPLYFGFKGGKGVATAMGAYLGLNWLLGTILIAIWAAVILITRISSLGALIATVLSPIIAWLLLHDPLITIFISIMSLILLIRHTENIQRLINKSEKTI